MKTKARFSLVLILLAWLLSLSPQFSTLFAQSTAFTYQGHLTVNGTPVTGNVEFQPTLWAR